MVSGQTVAGVTAEYMLATMRLFLEAVKGLSQHIPHNSLHPLSYNSEA